MSSAQTVHELQQRITEMQPLRLDERALPTTEPLRPLLPDGGLRKGGSYAVHGSTALGVSLLAAASNSGAWCGVIGVPELGIEAAATLGVALDRCVLIPHPGAQATGIATTLSEALTVVLMRPTAQVSPGEAERLAARLREHGAAIVTLGNWPRTTSTLRVTASRWRGLGAGRGMLTVRELTVQSLDRRGMRTHTLRFSHGALATIPAAGATPIAAPAAS